MTKWTSDSITAPQESDCHLLQDWNRYYRWTPCDANPLTAMMSTMSLIHTIYWCCGVWSRRLKYHHKSNITNCMEEAVTQWMVWTQRCRSGRRRLPYYRNILPIFVHRYLPEPWLFWWVPCSNHCYQHLWTFISVRLK